MKKGMFIALGILSFVFAALYLLFAYYTKEVDPSPTYLWSVLVAVIATGLGGKLLSDA